MLNVEYLSCGLTALVCIYYFINAEKTWQKMVLSPCIAILGAEYITILYPAFQVPSGYVYFGIVVWMVVRYLGVETAHSSLLIECVSP